MIKKSYLLLLIITFFSSSCLLDGLIGGSGSQFIDKQVAPEAFVSELYGSSSQVLTISQPTSGHITWIGFIESNDYKYFKMTKIQSGSTTIRADGETFIDEEGVQQTFTPSSSTILEDVNVSASSKNTNQYTDGMINIAGGKDLKITVKYSPLVAIDSISDPHEAYLIVYYDEPQEGAVRIKLDGYTSGMKNEKCVRDSSAMTAYTYSFKSNKFNFYFCGAEVQNKGQDNDPTHGALTNLTEVSAIDAETNIANTITAYQVDDETVCLLSESLTGSNSSIPDFRFIIPEGLAPIDYIDISMTEGSYAECSLDADGNIYCDNNILIDTGIVPVSPLTATNQTFTADELETTDCTGFPAMSGSGTFPSAADGTLKLILKGTMLSDANTESYNIVDSLVLAEINLVLQ